MAAMRRILHPSDFSRASGAAFRRAIALAKANRGEVLVAHVLAPVVPMVGEGYLSPKVYAEIEAASRAEAKKRLDRLVASARASGARARGLLLEGTPHAAIVRAARGQKADVIVMGTHGRSGLAKFFLGSVAERVVATAPCPVLTVRGG